MNTSTQHPLHLPGTPQEGDLSVAQKLQIESIQGNIKKIVWVIGDAIENLKENQRKIEEIAVACEQAEDKRLMPFAKLIQETGNVNENDSNGQTVLMSASRNGHTEIVKLLLAHPDIQVNKNNSHGDTALMNAVFYSRVDITELLLFHPGIFVNHQNSHGDTALIYAARRDHKVITKLLLAHQEIQVNEKKTQMETLPLCLHPAMVTQ
jgi:ankyrin repeat protein